MEANDIWWKRKRRDRPMTMDDDTVECMGMKYECSLIDSDDVVNGSKGFMLGWRKPLRTNSQEDMYPAHKISLRTKHAESEPQRQRLPLSSERL